MNGTRKDIPTLDKTIVAINEFGETDDGSCAWAVLGEVGQRISEFKHLHNQIPAIIQALYDLHGLGIVHGDARLPNIVYCGSDGWKWIDLRHSRANVGTFVKDWLSLLSSISSRFGVDLSCITESSLIAMCSADFLQHAADSPYASYKGQPEYLALKACICERVQPAAAAVSAAAALAATAV